MKKKFLLAILLFVGGLFLFSYWALTHAKVRVPVADLWQPPEMRAAQHSSKEVIGDLGGVPVKIPKYFANYVEYDGDPGFGEKRKGEKPVRTYQSKLSSFGFYVHYPDMVGLSTPELRQEKKKESIYTTMWLSVGINAGEIYPGNGSLDRLAQARVDTPNDILKFANYELLPNKEYDLNVYVAKGIDPKTNQPYREHDSAEDVFVYRDQSGKVTAFISCSNRPIRSAPCKQWISLEPAMKVSVHIHYRRGLLPEWQKIQESVTQLIYNFKSTTPQ